MKTTHHSYGMRHQPIIWRLWIPQHVGLQGMKIVTLTLQLQYLLSCPPLLEMLTSQNCCRIFFVLVCKKMISQTCSWATPYPKSIQVLHDIWSTSKGIPEKWKFEYVVHCSMDFFFSLVKKKQPSANSIKIYFFVLKSSLFNEKLQFWPFCFLH